MNMKEEQNYQEQNYQEQYERLCQRFDEVYSSGSWWVCNDYEDDTKEDDEYVHEKTYQQWILKQE